MKSFIKRNAVFWDVVPCRSCKFNRRFGGTYRLHLQDRKIRERGFSVSRWLQTKPPLSHMTPDLQGYAGQCTLGSLAPRLLDQYSPRSPVSPPPRHDPIPAQASYLLTHLHRPFPSPLYWFPMCPPLRFLHNWVFSTGGLVCSHLLKLVPRSRIFLPWRWRRYVLPKRRFNSQYLHGGTSQKTAFFIVAVKTLLFVHFPKEYPLSSSVGVELVKKFRPQNIKSSYSWPSWTTSSYRLIRVL
jgi:hypothetical protein